MNYVQCKAKFFQENGVNIDDARNIDGILCAICRKAATLSTSYYEYNGDTKPTVGSTVSLGGYTWTVVGNESDGNPVAFFCGTSSSFGNNNTWITSSARTKCQRIYKSMSSTDKSKILQTNINTKINGNVTEDYIYLAGGIYEESKIYVGTSDKITISTSSSYLSTDYSWVRSPGGGIILVHALLK